jgi:hypothetical protein
MVMACSGQRFSFSSLFVCVFLGFSVLSSFPACSSIFWEKPPPLFVLLFASPVHFWVFLLWLCFVHPHSPRFSSFPFQFFATPPPPPPPVHSFSSSLSDIETTPFWDGNGRLQFGPLGFDICNESPS